MPSVEDLLGPPPVKPKPQAFETNAQFHSRMDGLYGAGKWRDTSDYRDPVHNARVGGVGDSNHTRGTPDAPGAHDIVVDGEDPAAAARRLPRDYKALPEGRVGAQGPHLHIDEPPLAQSGSNVSVASLLGPPPPVASILGPKQPDVIDALRKGKAGLARPNPSAGEPQLRQDLGRNPVQQFQDETSERAHPALADLRAEMRSRQPTSLSDLVTGDKSKPDASIAQTGLRVGGDLLNLALSPFGGAAQAAAMHLPSGRKFTDPQQTREESEKYGDLAETLVPIPGAEEVAGGARAAKAAIRGGRELLAGGREAEAAADAAKLGTRSLPKPPQAGQRIARPSIAARETPSVEELLGPPPKPRNFKKAGDRPPPPPPQSGRVVVGQERDPAERVDNARTLAAKVEKPPRTDIVGDEANPATRTANALYRLNGSNIADKIELGRARSALKKAHGDKSEALYHALEEPLAGGDAKVSPELGEAKAALQPYLKEQTNIINRLRERNDPTLDQFTEDQGYVHRIRSDQPDILDTGDQGGPRSPFQSRKSLVKTASSQKQRKFIALEDPATGERIFPKGQDEAGNPYDELRPGMTFRPAGEGPAGSAPKQFKVVQPTTKEIEANTTTRFKKDAIDNTIANVFQLRRVERNLDVLEQTLDDMKERGVAHREEWNYKDPETGRPTVGRSNEKTPQGFRTLPDVPQLKGWVFDHSDAQVQELKDWLPKHDEDWVTRLDRVNNFMLRSDFLSPFVHPKNIAEFWGTSRGWDWLHPEGYGRLARTLPQAWREVMTMGPKYQEYLREGSALLSADSRTQDFNAMLTDKAGDELINDKQSFAALKQHFGDAITTPAKLYAKFQEASHKMMWSLGDTMMMQRVLELQEKGMPIRDAIKKAEEVIPNYRVPAQIMDSPTGGRMLHHLFSNNRFFSVGRYHYNRLAAWGRMFKKVAKGSKEERTEALGQFLAMAVMGSIIVPAVDKAIQIATGNSNARVKRGGILSLPDAGARTAEGKEGVAHAIAQVIDLSPEARLATQAVTNKDWKGDDILSKYRSPGGNVAGAAELPIGQFGPAQGGLEALSPGYGPERTIGNMFGVDLPQKPPGQVKGSTAKMLRGKYKRQDQKDPLARALGAP